MKKIIYCGLLLFGVFALTQCKQENGGCDSGEMNIGTTVYGEPICIDKLDNPFTIKPDGIPYYVHEKFGEIRLVKGQWLDIENNLIGIND
tara:strand:- start:167 stop:436 length:270 start_codon:yes stop_codon:yes gene_type:complete